MLYNAWPVIITALLHALLCLSTYSTTQIGRHTHTHRAPCVDSHILYSSTLTHVECVLSNSRARWVRGKDKRGRRRVGGVVGLKVKETQRENLDSTFMQTAHLHDCMNLCVAHVCVPLKAALLWEKNSRLSPIETLCGWHRLAGTQGYAATPHNLILLCTAVPLQSL